MVEPPPCFWPVAGAGISRKGRFPSLDSKEAALNRLSGAAPSSNGRTLALQALRSRSESWRGNTRIQRTGGRWRGSRPLSPTLGIGPQAMNLHSNIAIFAGFRHGQSHNLMDWPRDQQVGIIAALTEGCSIRAVERLTGVRRDTIMRLGFRVGVGCSRLHNSLMRDLRVNRIELDEAWSYVGKKRKQVAKISQ